MKLNREGPSARREVARLQKSRAETLVVAVQRYNGRTYLDMRVFTRGPDGVEMATVKGLTLSTGLLSQLQVGLIDAEGAIEEMQR